MVQLEYLIINQLAASFPILPYVVRSASERYEAGTWRPSPWPTIERLVGEALDDVQRDHESPKYDMNRKLAHAMAKRRDTQPYLNHTRLLRSSRPGISGCDACTDTNSTASSRQVSSRLGTHLNQHEA